MRDVAIKHNLYKYARFGSEVTAAKWDAVSQQWRVSVRVLSDKEAEFCEQYDIGTNFVVSGIGQLNKPHFPDIPGLNSFPGKTMHSARWDWSYDLTGKRVGIIGNGIANSIIPSRSLIGAELIFQISVGATAVQIIPELVKVASHLTIFQRSPNWVVPRLDQDVPEWQKKVLKNIPALLHRRRAIAMDGREEYFKSLVQRESVEAAEIRNFCEAHIRAELPDRPDLWEALTPNYPVGCRRILISDDFYPSLRLPNVHVETRAIQSVTQNGILVHKSPNSEGEQSEEEIPLDLIIVATGFQTLDFLSGIQVHGVGDQSLKEIWSRGASALYGVCAESLPNFGMLYGPNTNLGHNSILLMIESQTRYLTTLVEQVFKARKQQQPLAIMPKTSRIREWNASLQKALSTSSFADPRCQSWYKTGDNLVTNNWSGTVVDYQKLMATIDWSDYEIVGEASKHLTNRQTYIGRVVEETWIGNRTMMSLLLGSALTILTAAAMTLRSSRHRRFV